MYSYKLFLPLLALTIVYSLFIGECSHRTDLAESNSIEKIAGKYFFKTSNGEIFQTNAFNGCIRKITSTPKISRKTDNYIIISYYLELHGSHLQRTELAGEEIPKALNFFFDIPLRKNEEGSITQEGTKKPDDDL